MQVATSLFLGSEYTCQACIYIYILFIHTWIILARVKACTFKSSLACPGLGASGQPELFGSATEEPSMGCSSL